MREVSTPVVGTPPADPVENDAFGKEDPFNPSYDIAEPYEESMPEPDMDDFYEDDRDFEQNSTSPQKPISTPNAIPKEQLNFMRPMT